MTHFKTIIQDLSGSLLCRLSADAHLFIAIIQEHQKHCLQYTAMDTSTYCTYALCIMEECLGWRLNLSWLTVDWLDWLSLVSPCGDARRCLRQSLP
jgi:hypothetical protein